MNSFNLTPDIVPASCLSVCPSHGWTSQKQLKLGSCNVHHNVIIIIIISLFNIIVFSVFRN